MEPSVRLRAMSSGDLQILSSEHPHTHGASTGVVSHNAAAADLETQSPVAVPASTADLAREVGGRGGLEPTRYGDWEKNGRCIDF